jgi:5-oxoprolinase (ATP-hydrolysing) subunit C
MSPAALIAIAPAPLVSLQDAGRTGWQRFGVSRSGAMDVKALAVANALVGNPADTPALEFAYTAGEFRLAATSCRVAVAGGRFTGFVDDRPIPAYTTATMTRGQTLRIGGAPDAVWGYLAVAGGFDLPLRLGSHSTHVRSGIGGFAGRFIREGDVLGLLNDRVHAEPERTLLPPALPAGPLRVVMGPQEDFFTPEAIATFLSAEYRTTHQMDRLGYRLDGPALEHAKGYNIISDGIVPGCIQVPGGGTPIVLLRDAQPPGGYPKIATLVSPDLGRLAQMRPGTPLRFTAIDIDQAHALRRQFVAGLAALRGMVGERRLRLV